jgi:hypothetical protein
MFGFEPASLLGRSLECLSPSRSEFKHIGQQGLAVMPKSGQYSDERIMRHRSRRLSWCHDLTIRKREIARQPAAVEAPRRSLVPSVSTRAPSKVIAPA